MSSEIVEEEPSAAQREEPTASSPAEDNLKDDVYTAAAYGDLEKLQRLVEAEGHSVGDPDGLGYFALQWAALNNRAAAAHYILEHGGDVNVADHTGQTALHWSAVRGAVQVAELLLKEGATANATDLYGYQITHVAAQYGQTAFLYHVVTKWNADPDVPDNDGRSPLHWAAYKGFADCIRLLLFLDAYRGRQDKEGCTPLHWASIRGNLEACTVLVQAGKKEDLAVTDNTGFTPAQLAADKNHRQVAFFLGNARRLYDKRWDNNSPLGRLKKLGLAPALWCLIIFLLFMFIHSVITGPNLMEHTGFRMLAWLGVFLATAGLVMFYRCWRKDPGYIKMNVGGSQHVRDDEPLLIVDRNEPALLSGNWSQLCATCKIVRPLRSKHCSTCDRCVEQFDHHCPWVSNCIGKKNKWDFFTFLVLETSAMVITAVATIIRITHDPSAPTSFGSLIKYAASQHPGATAFFVMDFLLFFGVAMLTGAQASQIARNITTNETANAMRYNYLRGPGGRFHNPYDHGVRRNCSHFLIKGYSEDVTRPDDEEQLGSIGMLQMGANANLLNGEAHSHGNATNSHVCVDVDKNPGRSYGHGCCSSQRNNHSSPDRSEKAPVGLGLGLGTNKRKT